MALSAALQQGTAAEACFQGLRDAGSHPSLCCSRSSVILNPRLTSIASSFASSLPEPLLILQQTPCSGALAPMIASSAIKYRPCVAALPGARGLVPPPPTRSCRAWRFRWGPEGWAAVSYLSCWVIQYEQGRECQHSNFRDPTCSTTLLPAALHRAHAACAPPRLLWQQQQLRLGMRLQPRIPAPHLTGGSVSRWRAVPSR